MKRIVLSSVLAFALTLSLGLYSCKPEKKELGPRVSQIDGISGNWILNRVAQIDVNVELAFVESDTLLDVSSVYIAGQPMEIEFQKDGTYSTVAGSGSSLFGPATGTWKFDDNDYPSFLIFNEGTGDETTINLLSPVRPQDPNLAIKVNKVCNGERTVSYHFWYNRK
jgi:hypothetical protein